MCSGSGPSGPNKPKTWTSSRSGLPSSPTIKPASEAGRVHQARLLPQPDHVLRGAHAAAQPRTPGLQRLEQAQQGVEAEGVRGRQHGVGQPGSRAHGKADARGLGLPRRHVQRQDGGHG